MVSTIQDLSVQTAIIQPSVGYGEEDEAMLYWNDDIEADISGFLPSTEPCSCDWDDDKDQSDHDQEESEDEPASWTDELEAFPAKYRKPARLSKHIRIGRVSGERSLPYAKPITFDTMVKTPTIFVDKISQIKRLCDVSLDDRLTLIRRPSGFGKTSLLSMVIDVLDVNHREEFSELFGPCPPLKKDVLILYRNLDTLPTDSAVFRAGLVSCLNDALHCFLTRYRDLLGLTQHQVNRRLYTGRRNSILKWVMDLAHRRCKRVVVLLDNVDAPLIKSTEDNFYDIRISLENLLISPIRWALNVGTIIGGVAVALPLSHEPEWASFPSEYSRIHIFDDITIDGSEWDVVNRCLGFTKAEISALAAERLSAGDVDAFVDDVMQTVDAFESATSLPSTYSMSGVLAQLRKRSGQPDSRPLLPLPPQASVLLSHSSQTPQTPM